MTTINHSNQIGKYGAELRPLQPTQNNNLASSRPKAKSSDKLKWIIPIAVVLILFVSVGIVLVSKSSSGSKGSSKTKSGGRSVSSSSSSQGRYLGSGAVNTDTDYDDIYDESNDPVSSGDGSNENNFQLELVPFSGSESVGTCTTAECKDTVKDIISSMDTSIDPCDNFYEFACRGWQNNNPRPPNLGEWSVFQKLQNQTDRVVTDILEEPSRKRTSSRGDITAMKQAKRFYNTCKNSHQLSSKVALKPMYDTLEKYGGWPILYHGSWDKKFGVGKKFDWMRSLVDMKRFFDSSIILDIFSYQRFDGDVDGNRIIIKQDGDSSEVKNLLPTDGNKEETMALQGILALQELIVNIARELLVYKGEKNINNAYLEATAYQVIFVQSEISRLKSEAVDPQFLRRHGINSTSGDIPLDELQSMLDSYTFLVTNKLQLPQLLRMLYGSATPPVYIQSDERVMVTDFHYILKLANFLSTIKPEPLANYMHFYMALEMSFKTTKKMRGFVSKFSSATEGTKEDDTTISTICTEQVKKQFHHVVGQAYVQRRYPHVLDSFIDELKIQIMFSDMKQKLIRLISQSTNINFFHKQVMIIKTSYSALCYGYPSWIYDDETVQEKYNGLKINQATYLEQYMAINAWDTAKRLALLRKAFDTEDKCIWDLFAGTVGAVNDVTKFAVYLPLGILQPPFSHVDYPSVLNYGKLGTILGHELAHSLTGLGWTRYSDGSLTSTAECFVRQFDNFTTDELQNESVTVDGRLTVQENIPDSTGLLNAYLAFKGLTANLNETDSGDETAEEPVRMNGLEKYTDDQLFFLGFAQNFCESSTLETMINSMKRAKHSPGMFRILGTLKNSKEFSEAWNCPVGSKMNPTWREYERCPLF